MTAVVMGALVLVGWLSALAEPSPRPTTKELHDLGIPMRVRPESLSESDRSPLCVHPPLDPALAGPPGCPIAGVGEWAFLKVPAGTTVHAPFDGTVVRATTQAYTCPVDGEPTSVTFVHVQNADVQAWFGVVSDLTVTTGDTVTAGQVLARSATDPCTQRDTLYFSLHHR